MMTTPPDELHPTNFSLVARVFDALSPIQRALFMSNLVRRVARDLQDTEKGPESRVEVNAWDLALLLMVVSQIDPGQLAEMVGVWLSVAVEKEKEMKAKDAAN